MEHVIYSSMFEHLNRHQALRDEQLGFRQHRSCEIQLIITVNVTGPAKTGHVGTNYTPLLYWSYLITGKVYFHSVTCIIMPMKCLLSAENCNTIA